MTGTQCRKYWLRQYVVKDRVKSKRHDDRSEAVERDEGPVKFLLPDKKEDANDKTDCESAKDFVIDALEAKIIHDRSQVVP
jgi:hypothetical protein